MKLIGLTGRRIAPQNIPSAEQIIKNQILLNRLKREQESKPKQQEVHYEPKEGVTYQLHDEAQPKKKRMMGFREWCEALWNKPKTPPAES
jgi:hypothetical protein